MKEIDVMVVGSSVVVLSTGPDRQLNEILKLSIRANVVAGLLDDILEI